MSAKLKIMVYIEYSPDPEHGLAGFGPYLSREHAVACARAIAQDIPGARKALICDMRRPVRIDGHVAYEVIETVPL